MTLTSANNEKTLPPDEQSAMPCQRLVLGAAQFGMPYGIANTAGQPDSSAVIEIVSVVWSRGVRFFDTAQAYGTSEEALGQALTRLSIGGEACVVSKLKAHSEAGTTLRSVEESLKRLGVQRLWGILLHQEEQLDCWSDSVAQALVEAKRAGLASHLGASVYSPLRALQALELDGLDVIQVQANVFDRRMERAGVFERARERGKIVFVRSVYLQGLALMPPDAVPRGIPQGREAADAFQQFCEEFQTGRDHLAVDFVRRMAPEAKLIIGAETVAQAVANCALFEKKPLDEKIHKAWRSRWPHDLDSLIDPRRWPLGN
jgi:aryl-alcohol dehydrogenase-like predicted oxidoreductase